jgi:hypothetical protein
MKTRKENPTAARPRFLPGRIRASARAGTAFGITAGVVFVLIAALAQAGEVRFTVGSTGFVNDTLSNGQSFEAFKFDLPQIPQGARIDFAGLVLYIDRPPVDLNDTLVSSQFPLALVPITSDWTATSLKNGQVVEVDESNSSFAVSDARTGDKIELDITQLVKDWLKRTKTNRGFMLVPELSEEKTDFSVKSNPGVKVEVVIYYTGPEVTSKE